MIRSRVRRAIHVGVLGVAVAWAGHAFAQVAPGEVVGPPQARPPAPPEPAASGGIASRGQDRGPVALLLHIGPYSGFGAGVAVGTPEVGVRASMGWSPVLAVLRSGSEDELKFYSGLQISPDLYVRLLHPRPATHVGLQGGYRYSSLFGHGLAAGGYGQFALSGPLDVLVSLGLVVYPDGEDRLKKDQNLPSSASFSFPGPSVNFGISVGLVFFP